MLLVNPGLGDKLLYGATDQLLESYVAPEEERVQPVRWVTATAEEHSRGIRLHIQHSKVGTGRVPRGQVGWGTAPWGVGDDLGWWVTL